MSIFDEIKTEKDLESLKRKIMREDILYTDILRIRKKLNNPAENLNTTPEHVFSPYENSFALSFPRTRESSVQKPIRKMPTNPEMLELYEELILEGKEIEDKNIRQLLKRLKVRSNSGVAVISLLTKPYSCPGKCIYCPTEKNMPKSYLSKEPAAARALGNDFDPYKQVWSRLSALTMNGHPTDKIEMIIIGGTFDFYPREYQEEFIKEAFRACNNWLQKPENYLKEGDLSAQAGKNLDELHRINENSCCRIIGLSVETRPDYISFKELDWLRTLGITKVEIGVQHLNQHVLDFNKRDMSVASMEQASETLRDAGFKFVYHMMPNLPESNEEMDVQMFKDLYNGKYHHPDMIKIYPCVILENTELYEMWKNGKVNNYKPYDDETLANVLSKCEKEIKNYTRIIRMIRDIPADYITASSKKSNLREVVDEMHKKEGYVKQDIRAREIRDEEIEKKDFVLTDTIYETERGEEYFLQFENKEKNQLAAFCRLRLPKGFSDKELAELPHLKVLVGSALIRELHTYGTIKKVGEEGSQSQHVGFGTELLLKAEEIAREKGFKKIAIIAGVGVREYYKKRGYHLAGTYMVKEL